MSHLLQPVPNVDYVRCGKCGKTLKPGTGMEFRGFVYCLQHARERYERVCCSQHPGAYAGWWPRQVPLDLAEIRCRSCRKVGGGPSPAGSGLVEAMLTVRARRV